MRTGAPVAPAQEAAPCLAVLLDDWVLPNNHDVPLITQTPGGELRTMMLLLFQNLTQHAHTKDSLAKKKKERHVAPDVLTRAKVVEAFFFVFSKCLKHTLW